MSQPRLVVGGVLLIALLGVPVSGQDGPASVDDDAASGPSGSGAGEGADPAQIGALAPRADTPLVTADDKPFARLFPHLFSDLRRLPSVSTAVALGLGALATGATMPIDDHVSDHATAGGTNQIFYVGGMIGGGYVQAGGAIVVYALGRLTQAPSVSHLGADLIRTQALNGLLTHGAKMLIRRGRPGGAPGHLPATYSFPSAHASSTWSSATVIWRHFGWQAGVPAAAIAAYVSGARVQQQQHFLSDVAFGAALGIAAGRTVTWDHGGRRIVAAPVVLPGGVGVTLTVARR